MKKYKVGEMLYNDKAEREILIVSECYSYVWIDAWFWAVMRQYNRPTYIIRYDSDTSFLRITEGEGCKVVE